MFLSLFLSLLYAFFSDNFNSLKSLFLLLYYSPYLDDTNLKAFFARFFITKVGPIGVFFVVLLYIKIELSSISAKIIIKDKNKSPIRYCLRKPLENHGKANVKNSNRDSCSIKKSAVIRFEYCVEKKSIKGPQSFNKKPSIARLGNTRKEVFDISETVFC